MFAADVRLNNAEEKALIENGSLNIYPKGDLIYAAGQQALEVHYILRGWVNVFKVNNQGRQVSLGLRYGGEFAGLSSFVCHEERGCYGVAMMDSEIVSVPREKFDALLGELPGFSRKIIFLLGNCLKNTQNSLVYFISHQTDKRLILTLLNIARHLGREFQGKRLINLKLSQEELANIVGCSRQTANNLLMELKSTGCIEMKGREIVSIFPERLAGKVC